MTCYWILTIILGVFSIYGLYKYCEKSGMEKAKTEKRIIDLEEKVKNLEGK